MKKFIEENKEIIREIHLISGKSLDDIKEFFETLSIATAIHYLEDEYINIPLLGKLKFVHEKDEIVSGGIQAVISHEFVPDPFLLRIIGQIKDEEETEIEKMLKKQIKNYIEKCIEA